MTGLTPSEAEARERLLVAMRSKLSISGDFWSGLSISGTEEALDAILTALPSQEVTQADRDAAADYLESLEINTEATIRGTREGQCHAGLVRAFARHRLAALPPLDSSGDARDALDWLRKGLEEALADERDCYSIHLTPNDAERLLAALARPQDRAAPDGMSKALADAIEVLEHVQPEGNDFDLSVQSVIEQGRAALANRTAPNRSLLVEALYGFLGWADHEPYCPALRDEAAECSCGLSKCEAEAREAIAAQAAPVDEAAVERIVAWLKHFDRDGASPAARHYAELIERGEHRSPLTASPPSSDGLTIPDELREGIVDAAVRAAKTISIPDDDGSGTTRLFVRIDHMAEALRQALSDQEPRR